MNTPDVAEIMSIPAERISHLCRKYHIKKLSIFGSTLHGERNQESDLDILVEFIPGHVPGFEFIDIQEELSAIFNRTVDLCTPEELSGYFRDSVVKEAQQIYAGRQD